MQTFTVDFDALSSAIRLWLLQRKIVGRAAVRSRERLRLGVGLYLLEVRSAPRSREIKGQPQPKGSVMQTFTVDFDALSSAIRLWLLQRKIVDRAIRVQRWPTVHHTSRFGPWFYWPAGGRGHWTARMSARRIRELRNA